MRQENIIKCTLNHLINQLQKAQTHTRTRLSKSIYKRNEERHKKAFDYQFVVPNALPNTAHLHIRATQILALLSMGNVHRAQK